MKKLEKEVIITYKPYYKMMMMIIIMVNRKDSQFQIYLTSIQRNQTRLRNMFNKIQIFVKNQQMKVYQIFNKSIDLLMRINIYLNKSSMNSKLLITITTIITKKKIFKHSLMKMRNRLKKIKKPTKDFKNMLISSKKVKYSTSMEI